MAEIRIGISGWTYAPWRGVFFPEKLPQKKELAYASRQVNSIEINGTFYSLQTPGSFQKWYDETPPGFCFAVKGSRYITHLLRLKDFKKPLCNFMASGLLCLREKLGPFLWQFPPNMRLKDDRFEKFIKVLPRDTKEIERLARQHDGKVAGRAVMRAEVALPLRHAFEFRHESFRNPDFLAMMREFNTAVVVADSAGKWPYMEEVTSDFMYIRLHGKDVIYVSGYTDEALDSWAKRITTWASGKEPRDRQSVLPRSLAKKPRDIYVYFDNDVKAHAPFDAINLAKKLKVNWRPELKDVLKETA